MIPATQPQPIVGEADLVDGRYRLVEPVAQGGMGTVWLAYDERLSRQVAVKILHEALSAESQARLAAEARTLARLSHPHIAAVYDVGRTGALAYLVMELIDGRPVSAVLAECGSLPWQTAAEMCAQVAEALVTAHARGVVHRDVTATNVMLTPAGAKLVDFGISALEGSPETGGDGNLVGTPPFIAPERLDGHLVAPSCDVYAVGVLLYRCLTGRSPWSASTPRALLIAQHDRDPEPLPAIEGLPAEVADLYRRCLARDPADRPTAAELADVLRPAAADTLDPAAIGVGGAEPGTLTQILPTITATADMAPPRRRLWPAAIFALTAGLLLSAAFAWSIDDRLNPGTASRAALGPAAGTTDCAVGYQQVRDDGEHFAAVITMRYAGRENLDDWRLSFRLADGQRVEPSRTLWRQDGDVVTATGPTSEPGVGGSVSLPLVGVHSGVNPLPTAFHLDATPCAVTVLGTVKTTDPRVPLEQAGGGQGSGAKGNGNGARADRGDKRGQAAKEKDV